MSRNLYKTLQKEGTKRTDEDLVEAGADFLNCKGGARYAKTTNAIWMWHSLTQSWRKLYGSKYNDIENNWKALRESLSDTKIKSRKGFSYYVGVGNEANQRRQANAPSKELPTRTKPKPAKD